MATENVKELSVMPSHVNYCEVLRTVHFRIASTSLIFQHYCFYQISPTRFGLYCFFLRERFVSLAQNYLPFFFLRLERNIKYITCKFYNVIYNYLPPLWSSGQSFWLQIQRSRVRFPALPDFLSSSGSGTGSTQPREVN